MGSDRAGGPAAGAGRTRPVGAPAPAGRCCSRCGWTGLSFRVAAGPVLMALFAWLSQASGSLGGFAAWVFVMVDVSFAGQGAAWLSPSPGTSGPVVAVGERTGQVVGEVDGPGAVRAGEITSRGWPRPWPAWCRGCRRVWCSAAGPFGWRRAAAHPVLARCRRPGSGGRHRRGRAARPGRPMGTPDPVPAALRLWPGPRVRFPGRHGLEPCSTSSCPGRAPRIGLVPAGTGAGDRGGGRGGVRRVGALRSECVRTTGEPDGGLRRTGR